MKLPWRKISELENEKEELEASISEKQEQIEKLQDMLEAEKDRRSKLAREKQEAEEKLNHLRDKIEGLKTDQQDEEDETGSEFKSISIEDFKDSLDKLGSFKSDKKDFLTVYSPGKLSNHQDISDIRNSIPEEELRPLLNQENLLIFYDRNLGVFCFKLRAFFDERFEVSNMFYTGEIVDFVKKEKYWALVSRGESKVFSESDGDYEEIERITDRVNSQHGKGGFSQGRFERKRDEQVDQHLDNVEQKLEGLENLYLLGDKALCKELPGNHLGGFDPNSSIIQNFYRPRRLKNSDLRT